MATRFDMNLDETSFCQDPGKSKIVGLKGFQATRTTSSPGRDNTTVLFACSSWGQKIIPLIIFKGTYLWNTSLPLMSHLHQKGFLLSGTIQLNRARDLNLQKKALLKEDRGYCVEKSTIIDDVKLSVTTWVDNKAVSLCFSYVGKEPMGMVKRFDRKKKVKIDVPCPKSIMIYNKYMGGVDLLDSMLGFYRIKIRSKKWYTRLHIKLQN